jgi:hypothetical protein
VAPAMSLARLRKWMLDRVARKEVSVVQACREAGISTCRRRVKTEHFPPVENGSVPGLADVFDRPSGRDPTGGGKECSQCRIGPRSTGSTTASTCPSRRSPAVWG